MFKFYMISVGMFYISTILLARKCSLAKNNSDNKNNNENKNIAESKRHNTLIKYILYGLIPVVNLLSAFVYLYGYFFISKDMLLEMVNS